MENDDDDDDDDVINERKQCFATYFYSLSGECPWKRIKGQ